MSAQNSGYESSRRFCGSGTGSTAAERGGSGSGSSRPYTLSTPSPRMSASHGPSHQLGECTANA